MGTARKATLHLLNRCIMKARGSPFTVRFVALPLIAVGLFLLAACGIHCKHRRRQQRSYRHKLNPLFSGIELEAGGGEDGRLDVHEILGLRLRAHLVTLSACETALGSGYFSEAPPGDDLVGLTRAFLFAGSPSVLATLWQVDDRSTLELMQRFYARLRNGDKATALAEAQRKLRNGNGRYRHPYYWAPFVLVGAN